MATQPKTHDVTNLGEDVLAGAHQAWLAGLGAFATAREQASDLFARLVERGETLETRGKEQADRVRERLDSSVEQLGQAFDRSVATVLARLGVPTRDDLRELARRVEELSRSVSRLAAPAPRTRAAS